MCLYMFNIYIYIFMCFCTFMECKQFSYVLVSVNVIHECVFV